MQIKRHLPAAFTAAALAALALGLGCAGSSSGGDAAPAGPAGTVAMSVSDAATEDWAVIGVKLLGISLTPQGGGTARTILATPGQAPVLNLVQLDNLSDVLGNAQVPVGTYTQATLTLSANPGDVALTVASSPSATFLSAYSLTAGEAIPAADIQIKGATGLPGSRTVTVPITLAKPLVVTAGQASNLDVEFVLGHPAFIVGHPNSPDTIWTVNFNGTVRHNPVAAREQMVLRHLYGTVNPGAASDTLTITRVFPTLPVATPSETATATLQTLQLTADAANGGTLFQDLDNPANDAAVTHFSTIAASLSGRYVRAAARFENGALVAARLWASSSFNSVWLSPEGHVAHVVLGSGLTSYQILVESETPGAAPAAVVINNETRFFFRKPADPAADAAPLATGTAFLDNHNLVRGFKVHVSPVDPAAPTLVAASVDIETAVYSGDLSLATAAGFTYSRTFATPGDNYTEALRVIPATTPNGTDASGNPVLGFKWWDVTAPALADTTAAAAGNFAATVAGNVDFGGTVGPVRAWGVSAAIPDPNLSNVWDARWTILEPVRLPKGTVAGAFVPGGATGSFTMTVKGGNATPVTVNLSAANTQVYAITASGLSYTLTPVDISTPAAMSALPDLGSGASVVVYGVPQPGGTIMAYVLYIAGDGSLL